METEGAGGSNAGLLPPPPPDDADDDDAAAAWPWALLIESPAKGFDMKVLLLLVDCPLFRVGFEMGIQSLSLFSLLVPLL